MASSFQHQCADLSFSLWYQPARPTTDSGPDHLLNLDSPLWFPLAILLLRLLMNFACVPSWQFYLFAFSNQKSVGLIVAWSEPLEWLHSLGWLCAVGALRGQTCALVDQSVFECCVVHIRNSMMRDWFSWLMCLQDYMLWQLCFACPETHASVTREHQV